MTNNTDPDTLNFPKTHMGGKYVSEPSVNFVPIFLERQKSLKNYHKLMGEKIKETGTLSSASQFIGREKSPSNWRLKIVIPENHITPSTRPEFVQKLFDSCESIPDYSGINKLRRDGKDCSLEYSFPNLLRNVWIKQEIAKQELARKRRKERHRNRKKTEKKSKVAVARDVSRKIFLADGAVKFIDGTESSLTAVETPQEIPREPHGELLKKLPQEPPQEPPQVLPLEPPHEPPQELPQEPPQVLPLESPQEPPQELPQEPPQELPLEPPQVIPLESPQEPPKELPQEPPQELPLEPPRELLEELPQCPILPVEESILPPKEFPPENLPPPQIFPVDEEEVSTDDILLAPPPAFMKFPTLSTPQQNEKRNPGGMSGLLGSIKKGKALRKVEEKKKVNVEEDGIQSSIFAVMSRRAAIVGSESEDYSSEGSDWSD